MTTRRTFITGLMASAATPALPAPEPELPPSLLTMTNRDYSRLFMRPMFFIGPAQPQLIRWSEPQDFTNWDPT